MVRVALPSVVEMCCGGAVLCTGGVDERLSVAAESGEGSVVSIQNSTESTSKETNCTHSSHRSTPRCDGN